LNNTESKKLLDLREVLKMILKKKRNNSNNKDLLLEIKSHQMSIFKALFKLLKIRSESNQGIK